MNNFIELKQQANQKDFPTTKEAAAILEVSPYTLRNSRYTGKLLGLPTPQFIRIGKTIRYRASDLEAWINRFQSNLQTASEV